MQSVKIGKLLRQLAVLISRNFQLIWNQKLTLGSLILQAPLMVLVIKLVGEPDCFTSNLINIGSRTVLFIVCAMASFMGLLNSYREICKDREIIFREASVGVSLLATVLSKAITLFLVEAVQAGILTAGFVEIIHIPQNHLLLDTNVEIFITIFLLMAASSAMGLLVSASLKSSEAAVLLVLARRHAMGYGRGSCNARVLAVFGSIYRLLVRRGLPPDTPSDAPEFAAFLQSCVPALEPQDAEALLALAQAAQFGAGTMTEQDTDKMRKLYQVIKHTGKRKQSQKSVEKQSQE